MIKDEFTKRKGKLTKKEALEKEKELLQENSAATQKEKLLEIADFPLE